MARSLVLCLLALGICVGCKALLAQLAFGNVLSCENLFQVASE